MTTRIQFILLTVLLVACSPLVLHAQWVRTNGPFGGHVTSLASSGTMLFAGTQYGGVYRSADSGETWTEINTGLTSGDIRSIAATGSIVFASTGKGTFRSTDNGEQWALIDAPFADYAPAVVAASGRNVFIATISFGMHHSTDSGETWRRIDSTMPKNSSAYFLRVHGTELIAGMYNGGVFRSSVDSIAWNHIGLGGPDFYINTFAATGTDLFIGSQQGGVFRSTDNGRIWKRANIGLADTLVRAIAVHGTDILVATYQSGLYRSTDNGEHWVAASAGLKNIDVHVLASYSGKMFAGTGGNLYRSTDRGESWLESDVNMRAGEIHTLAVSSGAVVAITPNGLYRSTDRGANWVIDDHCPIYRRRFIGAVARDEALFVASTGGVYRTVDTGSGWRDITAGLPYTTIAAFAGTDTHLFAVTNAVDTIGPALYRSSDDGDTWEKVGAGLGYPFITALVARESYLFASTFGGLFRSSDVGVSWSIVTEPRVGMSMEMRGLAANATHIVVSILDTVYRSSDNGESWTASAPDTAFFVPLKLSSVGNDFYLSANGNASSLHRSTDNGATWRRINEGRDSTLVSSFAATATDLYIGTAGSGVWRRPLAELSSGVETAVPPGIVAGAVALYPNPATTSMTLGYRLDTRMPVTVTIHDALGRIVSQPVADVMQEVGEHKVIMDMQGMAIGVYLCSVKMGGVERTVRFVVMQ